MGHFLMGIIFGEGDFWWDTFRCGYMYMYMYMCHILSNELLYVLFTACHMYVLFDLFTSIHI